MKQTLFIAVLLCLVTASPTWAEQSTPGAMKVRKQSGIDYVSGGMDEAEKQMLKRVASKYPMQLVFTGEDGAQELEGVKVTVIDLRGDKVIEAISDGPWFYFNPPSGRYTMQAEYAGETVTRTVDLVGRRYIVLEFHFKGPGS